MCLKNGQYSVSAVILSIGFIYFLAFLCEGFKAKQIPLCGYMILSVSSDVGMHNDSPLEVEDMKPQTNTTKLQKSVREIQTKTSQQNK